MYCYIQKFLGYLISKIVIIIAITSNLLLCSILDDRNFEYRGEPVTWEVTGVQRYVILKLQVDCCRGPIFGIR